MNHSLLVRSRITAIPEITTATHGSTAETGDFCVVVTTGVPGRGFSVAYRSMVWPFAGYVSIVPEKGM